MSNISSILSFTSSGVTEAVESRVDRYRCVFEAKNSVEVLGLKLPMECADDRIEDTRKKNGPVRFRVLTADEMMQNVIEQIIVALLIKRKS